MNFQYYETVRDTISNLDRLIVTLLVQGIAFTMAALGIIGGLQDKIGEAVTFFITIPLFVLSVLLLVAVNLFTRLLESAVNVATGVEDILLRDVDVRLRLTSELHKRRFSGANFGVPFYFACTAILVAITGIVCGVFGYAWWTG